MLQGTHSAVRPKAAQPGRNTGRVFVASCGLFLLLLLMENGRIGLVVPGLADPLVRNTTRHKTQHPDRVNFSRGQKTTGTRERLFALSICSNDCKIVCLRLPATASLYPIFFHRSTWAAHTYTYRLPCFLGLFAPLRGSVVPYRRPVRAGLAEHCSARTSKPVH